MKKESLIDAIGKIDDNTIDSVAKTRRKKKSKIWVKVTAVAACICLAVTGLLHGFNQGSKPGVSFSAFAIEEAVYPQMAQYPTHITDALFSLYEKEYDEWFAQSRERRGLIKGNERALDSFINRAVPAIACSDSGENFVFSPLNIYVTLSVLAEVTDGESRQQILSLLGKDDIESLRSSVNSIWRANYCDDGMQKSIISDSIWLSDKLDYNAETMKLLADNYFASSFKGEFGSEKYNKMLQSWLDEQTGNLLGDYSEKEEFSPETLLGIATAVNFSAKWADEFDKSYNTTGIFHSTNGDKETEFMNEETKGLYYYDDDFSAVIKRFDSSSMLFIRPDDDKSVNDLLNNEAVLKFISGSDEPDSTFININLSVPKFDISSSADLAESFEKLGVNDIFDAEKADFTPMLNENGIGAAVGKISHCARISIDEEGCVAAAYTEMALNGDAAPPVEEVDFVLDKPFVAVVISDVGTPLFVGIVNSI